MDIYFKSNVRTRKWWSDSDSVETSRLLLVSWLQLAFLCYLTGRLIETRIPTRKPAVKVIYDFNMDYVLAETKSLDAVQQPVKSPTRIKVSCVNRPICLLNLTWTDNHKYQERLYQFS